MGRLTTSDFVVNNIGHCFICMEEMSPQLSSTVSQPGSSSSPIYSMLYLSRYLKIKMRKVFNEELSIPESLLGKVEMSTLKVSLCEECASWNSRLSELLRKLEKIEIEAASYLQLINGKLQRATQDGKSVKLANRCTDSELMGKLKVAEVLRKETMERCSQKLLKGAQFKLKVKIQKLSENDIEVVKQPKSKCNFERYIGVNSERSLNDVKLETSNSEGIWEEYENDYLDNSEERNEDPTKGNISQRMDHNSGSVKSKVKMNLKGNYLRNSRTGKHDCKLCPKSFASYRAFHAHYQSYHLKIGFKCKICNKKFTQKGNLKIHQNSLHLKLRFNCQFCNKSFSTPNNRHRHISLKKCKGMKTYNTSSKRKNYSRSTPQDQIDTIKLEIKTDAN